MIASENQLEHASCFKPAPALGGLQRVERWEQRAGGTVVKVVRQSYRLACRHEALLCVDVSTTMRPWMDDLRSGALVFFKRACSRGYHVGLIEFAGQAYLLTAPTRDAKAFGRQVDRLAAGGGTSLAPTLRLAKRMLIGHHVRAIAVLTDGRTSDHGAAVEEARAARAEGIHLVILPYGDADLSFIRELNDEPRLTVSTPARCLSDGLGTMASLLPTRPVESAHALVQGTALAVWEART